MIESNGLVRMVALGVCCFAAAGCHALRTSCNDPVPYQNAQTGAPLKIPPNLQAPDTTNALKIPQLNEPKPPPRDRKSGCLDSPPPFATPKPAAEPSA